jgi:hypothetical protein
MPYKDAIEIHISPEESQLLKLAGFKRVQDFIVREWGTLDLKIFLDTLMADTRDNTRDGFPLEVSSALVSLSLSHLDYLKYLGVSFEDDCASAFAVPVWKIPKNF